MADITLVHSSVQDWTAVAQNTIVESATFDMSDSLNALLSIQAALDTTTAHTGTKFIVQVSSNSSGDEDWDDFTEFVGLIGTAATDAIENNPLNAAETSLTLTGHSLTTEGVWLFIEDGTLINSEMGFVASQSTNAVVLLDGVTNSHVVSTAVFNVALTKKITLPESVGRVRVVVDNSYDNNGSTLNYKIRISEATDIA